MELTINPSFDKGLRFKELDPGTWFVIKGNERYLYVKIDSGRLLSVHDNFMAGVAHIMSVNEYPDLDQKEVYVVKVDSVKVTRI